MNKKIIIIISIIVIMIIAIIGAYMVDKNRMANNEPVVFSTWGYSYTAPKVGQVDDSQNNVVQNDNTQGGNNQNEGSSGQIDVEKNATNQNETNVIKVTANESISIELPNDWNYELCTDETDRYNYVIKFYSADPEREMTLYSYKERFGVCGTSLITDEITLESGSTATVGYYDGGKEWSFIAFETSGDDVAAINSGLNLEESNEALEIFKTMKIYSDENQ